ncbi:MAG: esterase [Ilumatobacteraceae bacterium]|nr:esterase [Ilumatobacteraceae bacterium]
MARVLCLHGMGGTGATMWPLVAALGAAGHTTMAPTLPGHGGKPEDLLGVTWADWVDAALAWPADVVVGQSMGGSLALAVAATGACRAVVAINPLAPDADAVDGLEWRLSRGHEWIEDVPVLADEIAYARLPIAALLAMTVGVAGVDLAAVTQPALLVSSVHDDVVDPASADLIARALRGPVRRASLDRGGHVATLDADRTRLATAVETFIRTHL